MEGVELVRMLGWLFFRGIKPEKVVESQLRSIREVNRARRWGKMHKKVDKNGL